AEKLRPTAGAHQAGHRHIDAAPTTAGIDAPAASAPVTIAGMKALKWAHWVPQPTEPTMQDRTKIGLQKRRAPAPGGRARWTSAVVPTAASPPAITAVMSGKWPRMCPNDAQKRSMFQSFAWCTS